MYKALYTVYDSITSARIVTKGDLITESELTELILKFGAGIEDNFMRLA